jgi:ApaG protein
MLTELEVLTQVLHSRIFEAGMYESTTRKSIAQQIRVQVEPQFIEEQSDPRQSYYFFAYLVRILNEGTEPIRLISRHWIITDGFGKVEEVEGDGVIGQQPTVTPGGKFEYSSYCPLNTPTGSMHGKYVMETSQGEKWEVEIPLFVLAHPSHWH